MTNGEAVHWGFLTEEDIVSSREFVRNGFLIVDVESNESLNELISLLKLFNCLLEASSSDLNIMSSSFNSFCSALTICPDFTKIYFTMPPSIFCMT